MNHDWFWEGNVVATLARYLERQGWRVTATAAGEQDLSLVARQDDRELLVEVKGYPSAPLARGPRAGQPKPTRMSTKARQWYADALLGVMLKRHARTDADIAIALPAHRTYRSLIEQTANSLQTLGVRVFLVYPNGDVETLLEAER
jgi:hypothetical protein